MSPEARAARQRLAQLPRPRRWARRSPSLSGGCSSPTPSPPAAQGAEQPEAAPAHSWNKPARKRGQRDPLPRLAGNRQDCNPVGLSAEKSVIHNIFWRLPSNRKVVFPFAPACTGLTFCLFDRAIATCRDFWKYRSLYQKKAWRLQVKQRYQICQSSRGNGSAGGAARQAANTSRTTRHRQRRSLRSRLLAPGANVRHAGTWSRYHRDYTDTGARATFVQQRVWTLLSRVSSGRPRFSVPEWCAVRLREANGGCEHNLPLRMVR